VRERRSSGTEQNTPPYRLAVDDCESPTEFPMRIVTDVTAPDSP
jgi:hypothetical protein